MNLKVDKALIKKYLDGDCDNIELELVRDFLKQENAQQIFDEVWNEQWTDKIKADNVVSNPAQNQQFILALIANCAMLKNLAVTQEK